MSRKITFSLDSFNRLNLQEIIARGDNWRERQRANTLIRLDDGLTMQEVANEVGIHVRTVGLTRMHWIAKGINALKDAFRPGAPKKIKPDQVEKLKEAASLEPLTAKELLVKHIEGGGTPVHLNTIKDALKRANFVWKRTRSSLKKKRDEAAFRASQIEIELLRKRAEKGEMVLAFSDESGFSQVHPNRNAWTPPGETHLIEATRGKRLNVLAAMLSTGELFSKKSWNSTTAEKFTEFVVELKKEVGKDLTIILDNASIHKAKATKPIMDKLEKEGVTLYFLPPYSPELNRIEKLWHLMKYSWMSVKSRTSQILEEDVDEILNNFGSKYKFSF
jgi:transposase